MIRRLAAGLLAFAAWAYNPPVDTAGPLTVRIEGPASITQTDTSVAIGIVLENKGDDTLQGTLRLGVIDNWSVSPSETAPFAVAPRGTSRLDFSVVAPAGAYNAHYPVHAFAEFVAQGQPRLAHPVLIIETRLPNPPRAELPVEWQAVEVSPNSGLALWRLPVRRAVIQVFQQEPRTTPVAWEGSDPETRATVQFGTRVQRGDSREGFSMHPPWFQGRAGTILAEFPLRLPSGQIRLRFANAIRDSNPGERASDGVTFRVRALPLDTPAGRQGEILFERHTDAKTWQDAEVDLSRFSGQAVRLQLESHPGPKNDTTSDLSYWAEPTLIAGQPAAAPPFPPAGEASARVLGILDQPDRTYVVRVWPGQRGLLDGAIGFLSSGRGLYFQGFRARVLGDALEDWRSPSAFLDAREEPAGDRYRVRHLFRTWAGTFDLLGEIWLEQGALRARFWLENTPAARPWLAVYLEDLAAGRWSERARQVYAGVGNVLREPQSFRLGFDGHRLATSFAGFDFAGVSVVEGADVPPSYLEVEPDTRLYALHVPHPQTLSFIPAPTVWDAVRTWRDGNGLAPAGGVAKLAGRFVFDLWGGRYAAAADSLRRSFAYGLTDAVVVWHNWQRWGYDYRLPDIFPPNPQLGTMEEFAALAELCKRHGVLFAPHDNYIDLYPDAEGYSYDQIAFNSAGAPVRAWFNQGRQAQSYRWRADRVRPVLERNLDLIREAFAPTSYFIDVWSSIQPYDYWTREGQFFDRISTRDTWGDLFAWIRDFLGDAAPQISESGHDQLIGRLDGAQTNHLRVDEPLPQYASWVWPIRCEDAERVPWFDAAHHDRFVLHGAGYENRYAGGLDTKLHGIFSDDYITSEVMTGHPAMAPAPFGRDVVRKYWLLHDLMRALALRRIDSVEFAGGNLHRQYIRWDNGAEVWINRGAEDWTAAGHALPQYGFYARVPGGQGNIEAAVEWRDGIMTGWSRSPALYYIDARPVVSDRLPLRLAVESLRFLGARRFELNLRWEASGPIPGGLRIFVHFVDAQGNILFQGDHDAPVPTAQWAGTVLSSARVDVPQQFSAGQSFDVRVGLYQPGGGTRFLPQGPDDGTRRIRLGAIRLVGEGGQLNDVVFTAFEPPPDPSLARLNPAAKVISFAGVASNGALRLVRDGDGIILTPLPDSPKMELRFRWPELPWQLPPPRSLEALDDAGSVVWRAPVELQAGELPLILAPEPGVLSYRLR